MENLMYLSYEKPSAFPSSLQAVVIAKYKRKNSIYKNKDIDNLSFQLEEPYI